MLSMFGEDFVAFDPFIDRGEYLADNICAIPDYLSGQLVWYLPHHFSLGLWTACALHLFTALFIYMAWTACSGFG